MVSDAWGFVQYMMGCVSRLYFLLGVLILFRAIADLCGWFPPEPTYGARNCYKGAKE